MSESIPDSHKIFLKTTPEDDYDKTDYSYERLEENIKEKKEDDQYDNDPEVFVLEKKKNILYFENGIDPSIVYLAPYCVVTNCILSSVELKNRFVMKNGLVHKATSLIPVCKEPKYFHFKDCCGNILKFFNGVWRECTIYIENTAPPSIPDYRYTHFYRAASENSVLEFSRMNAAQTVMTGEQHDLMENVFYDESSMNNVPTQSYDYVDIPERNTKNKGTPASSTKNSTKGVADSEEKVDVVEKVDVLISKKFNEYTDLFDASIVDNDYDNQSSFVIKNLYLEGDLSHLNYDTIIADHLHLVNVTVDPFRKCNFIVNNTFNVYSYDEDYELESVEFYIELGKLPARTNLFYKTKEKRALYEKPLVRELGAHYPLGGLYVNNEKWVPSAVLALKNRQTTALPTRRRVLVQSDSDDDEIPGSNSRTEHGGDDESERTSHHKGTKAKKRIIEDNDKNNEGSKVGQEEQQEEQQEGGVFF